MIEFIFDEVINYIVGELDHEHKLRVKLIKWLKYFFDKNTEKTITDDQELLRKEEELKRMLLEDYIEFINNIKEIRKIYQKGKPFVKNQRKGQKKGHNFNYLDKVIKIMIRDGEVKEATQKAEEHLEHIRKYKSRRLYYYEKKKIKELGLII